MISNELRGGGIVGSGSGAASSLASVSILVGASAGVSIAGVG